jgi:hypothetical protein
MAIDIQTLEPAVLKAKEVATLEDVDTAVDSIDLSNYIPYDDINTVLANDTTVIDGSRITTGTIDASKVNVIGITADHINVDNTTTGFKLNDTAAGTSVDPNIEGAYIKGATIDYNTLAVTTASGLPTKTIFGDYYKYIRVEVSNTSVISKTIETDIYAYDYEAVPFGAYRLLTERNNTLRLSKPIYVSGNSYAKISVFFGSVLLESYTYTGNHSPENPLTVAVGGINILCSSSTYGSSTIEVITYHKEVYSPSGSDGPLKLVFECQGDGANYSAHSISVKCTIECINL